MDLLKWFKCFKLKSKKDLHEVDLYPVPPVEIKVNGYKFPCSSKECLVRVSCKQSCDKIEMDNEKLRELFLKNNGCPDCGSEKFMEGPSGGMATNIKCYGCGHWFNMGLPLFIERIHITSDGGFYD